MRSFVSLCLTACVLKHIMACKCTGGGRYDPPPQQQEIKHLSWQAGIHMKDFALRFEEQIPSVDRHYLINFQWQQFGLSKRPYMQAINGNYPSKKFSRCADGDADRLFWFACLHRGTAKTQQQVTAHSNILKWKHFCRAIKRVSLGDRRAWWWSHGRVAAAVELWLVNSVFVIASQPCPESLVLKSSASSERHAVSSSNQQWPLSTTANSYPARLK